MQNKATNGHLGILKARIAKLREQLLSEEGGGGGGGGGEGFSVTRSGDGRVAMIGFPSVGKSTLLSEVTETKSLCAAYEFTTLTCIPGNLMYNGTKIQLLDLPGIIEGAAEGKGLGLRFLRHIERNPVLLFLVPADATDIRTEYETLLNELEKYNPDLLKKNRLLAVSKADMLDGELEEALRAEIEDLNPIFFSSVAQQGLQQLKDRIWQSMESATVW